MVPLLANRRTEPTIKRMRPIVTTRRSTICTAFRSIGGDVHAGPELLQHCGRDLLVDRVVLDQQDPDMERGPGSALDLLREALSAVGDANGIGGLY